jgi:hypothetical protein
VVAVSVLELGVAWAALVAGAVGFAVGVALLTARARDR